MAAARRKVAQAPAIALGWEQVLAWRMGRHCLTERAGRGQLLKVVKQIGGLHAQLMSSAELSAWVRLADLAPEDVRNALWTDKTLVKTWAMRGTLHLLPADDLPLYAAALSHTRLGHWSPGWYKYHGVTQAEIEAVIEAVPRALDGRCLTREQLADEVGRLAGAPHVRDLLLSGWGSLLKPAAMRGTLCFGPSQGQAVTFVRPDQWLSGWREEAPDQALQTVLRRYLTAYGPATRDDFARWWGVASRVVRPAFDALAGELVEVDVEGRRGWARATDVAEMAALSAPGIVRLLPGFDPYVVGAPRNAPHVLPEEFKGRVYRPQGWISPVLLVDGHMAGVWRHERRGSRISAQVESFARLPVPVKEQIEREMEQLGAFLDGRVDLRIG